MLKYPKKFTGMKRNKADPSDRIAFWNIVPGDVVKLRNGTVGQSLGYDKHDKVRGEGRVITIDRSTNRLYLEHLDSERPLAPFSLKRTAPMLIDPNDPSKGWSNGVTEIPRPVHYSNCVLRVPRPEGESGPERYASRIDRQKLHYNKKLHRFVWQRVATIKNADGTNERIVVPWPKQPRAKTEPTDDTATKETVTEETWLPWDPKDPVHLTPPRLNSSIHSQAQVALKRAEMAREQQEKAHQERLLRGDQPQRRLGVYEGFTAQEKKPKPPPVAQAPTASENVAYNASSLSEWARDPVVAEYVANGGRSFAPADYLDLAPRVGPAAGGEWTLPVDADVQGFNTSAYRRDTKTGKLVAAEPSAASSSSSAPNAADQAARPSQPVRSLSKTHLDLMPIELLMTADLTSYPHGMKWRQQRYQARKAEEAKAYAEERKRDEANVKTLRNSFKQKLNVEDAARKEERRRIKEAARLAKEGEEVAESADAGAEGAGAGATITEQKAVERQAEKQLRAETDVAPPASDEVATEAEQDLADDVSTTTNGKGQ